MRDANPLAASPVQGYAPLAKIFHWLTALLVLITIPVAIFMVVRGPGLNIWDKLTNDLYSLHKLFGVCILLLVIARLGFRLIHGAPAPEPTLEPMQRIVSSVVHWVMYVLLIIVGALGWAATSAYPALTVFGAFSLPAIVGVDQALADRLYALHRPLGLLLGLFIAMHIGAALFHHFIRKDNVLRRMLP